MRRVIWCGMMDAALLDGHARGDTITVVAEEIGVGNGTVRNRAKELGVRFVGVVAKPKLPPKDRLANERKFCDALADGATANEAANFAGYVNGNAVLQRIRSKLGWQAV